MDDFIRAWKIAAISCTDLTKHAHSMESSRLSTRPKRKWFLFSVQIRFLCFCCNPSCKRAIWTCIYSARNINGEHEKARSKKSTHIKFVRSTEATIFVILVVAHRRKHTNNKANRGSVFWFLFFAQSKSFQFRLKTMCAHKIHKNFSNPRQTHYLSETFLL